MKVVYILAAVVLVLFLIGQIRVGAQAEYSGEGPRAWVKVGCLKIQVFPLKKKDKPTKKKKKTKKVKKNEPQKTASKAKKAAAEPLSPEGTAVQGQTVRSAPLNQEGKPQPDSQTAPEGKGEPKAESKVKGIVEKVGGALDYAQHLLPIALEAVGSLYQKIQMDTLELELIVGAPDPADAAMRYGQASAALGALWYPLTQAFHVKDGNARVRMDFDSREMTVYAAATLTLKIGQIVWLALYFGIRALRAFLAVRKRQKKAKQQERKAA